MRLFGGGQVRQYLDLLSDIRRNGAEKPNRTGTGALSVFGRQLRFDLSAGFPLVTTKKVFWRGVVEELLWFLRGETNTASLVAAGVNIWNEWANENGDLGPVYGKQWRRWQTANGSEVDQICRVADEIRANPNSRRLLVSAWNVGELPQMRLAPCHVLFQFYVANGRLSCLLYQRSADMFLGAPFNIASYALLVHLMAASCRLQAGELVHTFGDAHIYLNHIAQVDEQLQREPKPPPTLQINPAKAGAGILDFCAADIVLQNYEAHPHIAAPVAV